MSWWGEKKAVKILEIEPPIDRVEQTQQRVRELKAQLDELDGEVLEFKTKHSVRTNRFGVLLGVNAPGFLEFARVQEQWRELLARRDKVVSAWHAALHEWSEAKQEAAK
jgi:hypothetical protein